MKTNAGCLEFFDAHCCLGRPTLPPPGGAPANAAELLSIMDNHGISRALVWHAAARDASVPAGNQLLIEQIATANDRLMGCWGFLPESENNTMKPEALFKAMHKYGIRALRAWPSKNRFLLNRESCGRTLAAMQERAVPLLLSASSANDWQMLYELLRDFPRLVVIATDAGLWGTDRYTRPLFEQYQNVHLEISEYQVAGGVQPIVETYGANRLLFGSGLPVYHPGGAMLTIKHAPVPEEARRAMAGETLAKLLQNSKIG